MQGYPADGAEVGFRLFRRWFGARYARATRPSDWDSDRSLGGGLLTVARRWSLHVTVVNTLEPDAEAQWEAARATIEEHLDGAGLNLAVFVPRNAPLPASAAGAAEGILS